MPCLPRSKTIILAEKNSREILGEADVWWQERPPQKSSACYRDLYALHHWAFASDLPESFRLFLSMSFFQALTITITASFSMSLLLAFSVDGRGRVKSLSAASTVALDWWLMDENLPMVAVDAVMLSEIRRDHLY